MTGLTLDAGALIAFDKQFRIIVLDIRRALAQGVPIAIPAGVVAQVWRDGARQALLARLLRNPGVEIVPLDFAAARSAGQLCGAAGTRDIVDASVVVCARQRKQAIMTADVDDIRRLDATVAIIRV